MWDVVSLKCTFRKTGDENLLELWDQVYQLASTIIFRHEEDSLVWQFSSNGIYSVPSLYKVINFIGIQPVLISGIRDIKSPKSPVTRDNLSKTSQVEDRNCLFCKEEESVNHLFIGCVVAQQLWVTLSKVIDAQLGGSLDSIGKF